MTNPELEEIDEIKSLADRFELVDVNYFHEKFQLHAGRGWDASKDAKQLIAILNVYLYKQKTRSAMNAQVEESKKEKQNEGP